MKVLLFSVALATFYVGTDAIRCYQCSSLADPSCKDPFDEDKHSATECSLSTFTHCGKATTTDPETVTRGCYGACKDVSTSTGSLHCCNTDGCNGAGSTALAASAAFLIMMPLLYRLL